VSSTFYKTSTQLAVKPVIPFVMQDLHGLAVFVKDRMDKLNLNPREVASRSGGLISHQTVHNILDEVSKEIKSRTIAGLAKGLGCSEAELMSFLRPEPMTVERFVNELRALGVEEVNPVKSIKGLTPADMEEIIAVARENVRATVITMVEHRLKGKRKT
jgi:hypothetical protein